MSKQKAPEGATRPAGRYEDVPAIKMEVVLKAMLDEVVDLGKRLDEMETELELVKVDVAHLDHPFS